MFDIKLPLPRIDYLHASKENTNGILRRFNVLIMDCLQHAAAHTNANAMNLQSQFERVSHC